MGFEGATKYQLYVVTIAWLILFSKLWSL